MAEGKVPKYQSTTGFREGVRSALFLIADFREAKFRDTFWGLFAFCPRYFVVFAAEVSLLFSRPASAGQFS
jgi:hypothetical protein